MFVDFRERNIKSERNIDLLPIICDLNGDQTHNVLRYGMIFNQLSNMARV